MGPGMGRSTLWMRGRKRRAIRGTKTSVVVCPVSVKTSPIHTSTRWRSFTWPTCGEIYLKALCMAIDAQLTPHKLGHCCMFEGESGMDSGESV